MIKINKNNVSKIQKLIAFIFIAIFVSIFIILQNNKIEKIKNQNTLITNNIENNLKDTLYILYNENLSSSIDSSHIHPDYKKSIFNKFKSVNETLKNLDMYLSEIDLSKLKIYKQKKNNINYYLYLGYIDLTWSSKTDSSFINKEKKEIKVYMIKEKNTYYITNIELNESN